MRRRQIPTPVEMFAFVVLCLIVAQAIYPAVGGFARACGIVIVASVAVYLGEELRKHLKSRRATRHANVPQP